MESWLVPLSMKKPRIGSVVLEAASWTLGKIENSDFSTLYFVAKYVKC